LGGRISADDKSRIEQALVDGTERLPASSTARDMLRLFLELTARQKGKTYWGEKTPSHIFHLNRIKKDFPNAKIIHIVRDPRDFLLSYKFAWRQKGGRKHTAKLYHPLVTSNIWARSVKAMKAHIAEYGADDCLEVRYEDLTSNSRQMGEKMCQFLGLPYDSNVEEVSGANSSFDRKNESLPAVERLACNWVCRNYLDDYQYPRESNLPASFIGALLECLTVPTFLLRAMPVVLDRFDGGLLSYLRARGLLGRS
jgi:hypothetical protein